MDDIMLNICGFILWVFIILAAILFVILTFIKIFFPERIKNKYYMASIISVIICIILLILGLSPAYDSYPPILNMINIFIATVLYLYVRICSITILLSIPIIIYGIIKNKQSFKKIVLSMLLLIILLIISIPDMAFSYTIHKDKSPKNVINPYEIATKLSIIPMQKGIYAEYSALHIFGYYNNPDINHSDSEKEILLKDYIKYKKLAGKYYNNINNKDIPVILLVRSLNDESEHIREFAKELLKEYPIKIKNSTSGELHAPN